GGDAAAGGRHQEALHGAVRQLTPWYDRNVGNRRHAREPGGDTVAVHRLDRALRDHPGSAARGTRAAADVPAVDDESHRRRGTPIAGTLSPALCRPRVRETVADDPVDIR